MSMTLLLALMALFIVGAMSLAWVVARPHPHQSGRSGWIDAIWSLSLGLAAAGAALAPASASGGISGRRWLVAGLVLLWALRLGGSIALRNGAGGDDPRYAELRREWGARYAGRLFGLLMVQAAASFLLSVSVLVASRNPAPFAAWSDIAGAAVLLLAIAGEAVADQQLRRFRQDKANKGKVCDAGLWGLSRHPNYFFEWFGWLGYALVAIGPNGRFGWGWLALVGPVLMYVLLVHISGIPPLEAHMERSRGDAFRDTQRRISAFWPLPQRRSGEMR